MESSNNKANAAEFLNNLSKSFLYLSLPVLITDSEYNVLFLNDRFRMQLDDGDFTQSLKALSTDDLFNQNLRNKVPQLQDVNINNSNPNQKVDLSESASCSISYLVDKSGANVLYLFEFAPVTLTSKRLKHCEKESLLKCMSNIMMVNEKREIIYFNHAMQQFMSDREVALKEIFPHFSADNLLGYNIDNFHSDPRRVENVITNMKETHSARLDLGGVIIRLIFNPFYDNDGVRIGTCAEWYDDTFIESQEKINKDNDRFMHDQEASIQAMAVNDLTVNMATDYMREENVKMATDFNSALTNINKVIAETSQTLEQVVTSVTNVSTISDVLASTSTQQSSALEEVSASVKETDVQIQANSENSIKANQFVQEASDKAQKGKDQMHEMLKAINSISDSSDEISKIIKVIDDIAFQTNLLALNAAVEAARAGEHGKGFAVVAQEVRNLAGRSADAAKETSELIASSVKQVAAGVLIAEETETSLEDIVEGVLAVKELVSEISVASKDQAVAINQVNTAITEINMGVQEVDQKSSNLYENANTLSSVVQRLNEIMNVFTVISEDASSSDMESMLGQLDAESLKKMMSMMKAKKSPSAAPPTPPTPPSSNNDSQDFGDF